MSYIPPELAHEPMEITQRGSIICSYRRWITGAILINTVPAITITSASRGVPRITSAPKRAMSYLLVILVAISTKQQDRPKLNGQSEFLRPQATRSWSLLNARVLPSAFSSKRSADILAPIQGAPSPKINKRGEENRNEDAHFDVPGPSSIFERDGPCENENGFDVENDEEKRDEIVFRRDAKTRGAGGSDSRFVRDRRRAFVMAFSQNIGEPQHGCGEQHDKAEVKE